MIRNFTNGDIVTSGSKQFLYGKEGTLNGVYHRLRMFLGEYFLDVSDGTPWFQTILGKTPQGVAEVNIKKRISSAPDVIQITEFDFGTDSNERRIEIDAKVLDTNNEQIQFVFNEELF